MSSPRRPTLSATRMLWSSLTHRRARSLSALVALTVSAAIATALLTLYSSLNSKLHHEFRSFGANVVITASRGASLPPDALQLAQQAAGPDAIAAPFAFAVATTDRGTPVVVAGTDFPALHRLNSSWAVDAWPEATDAALLGQKAANFVADEHSVHLTYAGKPVTLRGTGHLRTGSDEESRIYIDSRALQSWTGVEPTVIELQVPGGAPAVEAALTRLHHALPTLEIQPVRQLVEGESRIVDRTHALMYSAVLLISLTVAVSVLATLSASVLERRRDFALMKALGGSQSQLLRMFLLEAVVLAAAGLVVGWIFGSGAAALISKLNFDTATLPSLGALPLVALLNLAIAAFAALIPARVLRTLQPAALLRGE